MNEVNYVIHSSGPWKKHKYIRKVGNRYVYADVDDAKVAAAEARGRARGYMWKAEKEIEEAPAGSLEKKHAYDANPVYFDVENPGSQYRDNMKKLNNGDYDGSQHTEGSSKREAIRAKNEAKYQEERAKYLEDVHAGKMDTTISSKLKRAADKTVINTLNAGLAAKDVSKKAINNGKEFVKGLFHK